MRREWLPHQENFLTLCGQPLPPEEHVKYIKIYLLRYTVSGFFLSGAIPNCLSRWQHVRIAMFSAHVLITSEFKGPIRLLWLSPLQRAAIGAQQPQLCNAGKILMLALNRIVQQLIKQVRKWRLDSLLRTHQHDNY